MCEVATIIIMDPLQVSYNIQYLWKTTEILIVLLLDSQTLRYILYSHIYHKQMKQ